MPVKIKVSGFTILVAALAFFSHAAVPLGHIFFILALHESGHAFWAWFFHYPIRQLSILPFGLAMTLEHFGDGDAWEELVILAGGLAMHGVIPLLYGELAKLGWVSPVMLDWVLDINRSVFLFNVLPLYPLDGGRIVQSLWHCVLPYQTAQALTYSLSALLIPLVFVRLMNCNPMTLGVFGFLFAVNLISWRQRAYQAEHFYLYRLIHPCSHPLKLHRKQDLYRQRHNVILEPGGLLDEKQWLARRFGKVEPLPSQPRSWLI